MLIFELSQPGRTAAAQMPAKTSTHMTPAPAGV